MSHRGQAVIYGMVALFFYAGTVVMMALHLPWWPGPATIALGMFGQAAFHLGYHRGFHDSWADTWDLYEAGRPDWRLWNYKDRNEWL